MMVDHYTIESLQSRVPALSKSDFIYIREHMESGELFSKLKDPLRRGIIRERLLTFEDIIPTLYTLIKDIRYLKQPAKNLHGLLPKSRKTLWHRFHFQFNDDRGMNDTIKIQRSVSLYTTIPQSNLNPFDIAYQQLWLCAARITRNFNAYGQKQLAELAYNLGFSSNEIERERMKNPCQLVVEKALHEVLQVLRPNEKLTLDFSQVQPVISSFNNCLAKSLEIPTKEAVATITVVSQGEPLSRRSGSSTMDVQDLDILFLHNMHAPLKDYRRDGDEISSFLVKRSRHRAFFGALDIPETLQNQSSKPPSIITHTECLISQSL